MTEVDSNIVEWSICEMRERQSKERKTKKNGTKKRNDTNEEMQQTKGREKVKKKRYWKSKKGKEIK